MSQPLTRVIRHNVATRRVQLQGTLNRQYDVPTSWTPPRAKGIRKGATQDITLMFAPTPEKGVGDPRVKGQRIQYRGNTRTHVG